VDFKLFKLLPQNLLFLLLPRKWKEI